MTVKSATIVERYLKVKTILVSLPKPERSPYYELEKQYGLQVDWRPFIHVEPVPEKDFRKNRIRPDEFTSIILASKSAIEHFFRICSEMRIKMSEDTKYFCLSENVANYLQKFIVYRKRKVFVGTKIITDLQPQLMKHRDKEKFLLPCSNLGAKDIVDFLETNRFNYKEAMMYRTVSSDLSDLSDITYDVLVFFSPLDITSVFENFPDFLQNNTRIAGFGTSTCKAIEEHELTINIKAPTPESPSMTMALAKYLEVSNPE